MAKKPLAPLIPLAQFKKMVAAIAHVPKEAVSDGHKPERKPEPKTQPR